MSISYTIQQAISVSGVSRNKLYEALHDNKLKAKKLGSRTIIMHDDLMSFLDSLPAYKNYKV